MNKQAVDKFAKNQKEMQKNLESIRKTIESINKMIEEDKEWKKQWNEQILES